MTFKSLFLNLLFPLIFVSLFVNSVHIDSILYWHIINPYLATYGIADVRQALVERTKTTLRQVLGARVLQEIIENRELLGQEIQNIIDVPAHQWGVTVSEYPDCRSVVSLLPPPRAFMDSNSRDPCAAFCFNVRSRVS